MKKYINDICERVIDGGEILFQEALKLICIEDGRDCDELEKAGHRVLHSFCGDKCDLCSLVNAKSGLCSEDCAFCAQSIHYESGVKEYPFLDCDEIVRRAKEVESMGAHRFCIVTSGKQLEGEDFKKVLDAFRAIKEKTNLKLDGSLGILDDERIQLLKDAGVTRINHNLETSERFFPSICSTHTFSDRYNTVKRLKQSGIEVCSGGIIGLGEELSDRISLAFSLKDLGAECVPVNILNPRPGTPLEGVEKLSAREIIKTIAVFRLILPRVVIKIAGGREVNLGDAQADALRSGANGIIIGGYLTTKGNAFEKDLALVHSAGLRVG